MVITSEALKQLHRHFTYNKTAPMTTLDDSVHFTSWPQYMGLTTLDDSVHGPTTLDDSAHGLDDSVHGLDDSRRLPTEYNE